MRLLLMISSMEIANLACESRLIFQAVLKKFVVIALGCKALSRVTFGIRPMSRARDSYSRRC